MFNAGSFVRPGRIPVLMLVLAAAMLSGCESKQDKALDQAKQQAVATGQPQQVVSVDKNGTTTTNSGAAAGAGADDRGDCHDDGTLPPGRPYHSCALRPRTVSAVPQPVSVSHPAGTTLAHSA